MIITFIVDKTGLVIIFYDFGICSINNMTAIKGKDTLPLKLVGG